MDKTIFVNEIEKLRDFSYKLKLASENNTELVVQLNAISQESRSSLFNIYHNSEGPVKDIRKKVSEILKQRDIQLSELANIIQNAIKASPKSFGKMYKDWFNVLYMFLIADFRNEMNTAIEYISNSIIVELNASDEIVSKKFDFTGEIENGRTRCWIAFINKSHQTQKTAKQLFLKIENGEVEYCLYNRPKDEQIDKIVLQKGVSFEYEQFILVFKKHLQEILDDNWTQKVNYWRVGTTSSSDNKSYWEEMKSNNKICIGWSKIGDLNKAKVKNKNDIIRLFDENGISQDSNIAKSIKAGEIFKFFENITEGDIVLAQQGSNVLGIGKVKSEYEFQKESNFPHQKTIDWLIFNPQLTNDKGLRKTVFQIKDEKKISEIKNLIDKLTLKGNSLTINISSNMKTPLNQILFGPPGTGKTYGTINKAIAIIDDIEEKSLTEHYKNRKELKIRFKELMIDDWENPKGQIGFITFHQSMNYEDFIEGIKPLDPSITNNIVMYDVVPGLFRQICSAAQSKEGNFNEKIQWLKDESSEFDKKEPVIIDTVNSSFSVSYRGGKTFRIKPKLSQNTESDYPASIDNIRKIYEGGSRSEVYNPTYVIGILNYLYSKGLRKYSEIKEQTIKPFVLIIDEINRGNISQIFGELITLIEKDKRLGNDEELEVTLPYSKEKFGVPPNLYIIGTMNTADRSVEALDAALRRRFSFVEMPPQYDLDQLQYEFAGFKIFSILETINKRIEKLLDKDHVIGHSYFILNEKETPESKILQEFYENIIPLLQEYFFGDYGKIGMVLGKGFVRKKEWNKKEDSFADFDPESSSDFDDRNVYEIIDYTKSSVMYSVKIKTEKDENSVQMSFEKAIKLLMKQEIE